MLPGGDNMQLFRIAEMYSKDHRYISHVKFIIDDNDHKILTAVPKTRGEFIFFHPSEELFLQYFSESFIYSYTVFFREIKLIKNKIYYVFDVVSFEVIENNRIESRSSAEHQAVLSDNSRSRVVTILDISGSGLKIESKSAIENTHITVYFEKGNKDFSATGKVVWKKNSGDHFLYGVKTNEWVVLE